MVPVLRCLLLMGVTATSLPRKSSLNGFPNGLRNFFDPPPEFPGPPYAEEMPFNPGTFPGPGWNPPLPAPGPNPSLPYPGSNPISYPRLNPQSFSGPNPASYAEPANPLLAYPANPSVPFPTANPAAYPGPLYPGSVPSSSLPYGTFNPTLAYLSQYFQSLLNPPAITGSSYPGISLTEPEAFLKSLLASTENPTYSPQIIKLPAVAQNPTYSPQIIKLPPAAPTMVKKAKKRGKIPLISRIIALSRRVPKKRSKAPQKLSKVLSVQKKTNAPSQYVVLNNPGLLKSQSQQNIPGLVSVGTQQKYPSWQQQPSYFSQNQGPDEWEDSDYPGSYQEKLPPGLISLNDFQQSQKQPQSVITFTSNGQNDPQIMQQIQSTPGLFSVSKPKPAKMPLLQNLAAIAVKKLKQKAVPAKKPLKRTLKRTSLLGSQWPRLLGIQKTLDGFGFQKKYFVMEHHHKIEFVNNPAANLPTPGDPVGEPNLPYWMANNLRGQQPPSGGSKPEKPENRSQESTTTEPKERSETEEPPQKRSSYEKRSSKSPKKSAKRGSSKDSPKKRTQATTKSPPESKKRSGKRSSKGTTEKPDQDDEGGKTKRKMSKARRKKLREAKKRKTN